MKICYSEVPNRRADWNKSQFGKIAKQVVRKSFSELLNKQAENLRAGWEKNLKNLSEHALLLVTSEYRAWNVNFC